MGKFYCGYCDTYLTHDSASVRRSHLNGRMHQALYAEHYERVRREHPFEDVCRPTPAVSLRAVYRGLPGAGSVSQLPSPLPPPRTSAGLPPPPPNVYAERR